MFALWRTATICYIEVLRPETIMLRLHMILLARFPLLGWRIAACQPRPPRSNEKEKQKSQQPYRSHHFSLTKVYYAGGGELYIHTIHIS